MRRYYIIFKGRVQGVGFRGTAMMSARRNSLTGFVRNRDDGSVECEIQGEDTDQFLQDIMRNDRYIRIDDYHIKEIPLIETEREFKVRF